ncbi:MAG: hypothetical protein HY914_02945 [Desulfomonile tiedjei]|nr:hypothetical protein [Desulfomonile tiedjei]
MKKIVILLTVGALVAAGAVMVWGEKPAKEPRVYCCHGKGKCDKLHTKAECEKEGGKVVENCKECK